MLFRSEATCQVLKSTDAGNAWIASFQESAEPWFNFSTGSGFYHKDKIWIENVEVPFDFIQNYIAKLGRGEDLARPLAAIHAERDRRVPRAPPSHTRRLRHKPRASTPWQRRPAASTHCQ